MKTSVIGVHDMLSVLSLHGVETRIGEVPGVKSATVNFASGNVTVRYDETRLKIGDIKSVVRQSGHNSAAVSESDRHKAHPAPGASPAISGMASPSDREITPATPTVTLAGNAQSDVAAPQANTAPMDLTAASTHVSTPASAESKSTPRTATAAHTKEEGVHEAVAPH